MKNRRIGGFLTLVFAFFLALAIQALSPVPVKAEEPAFTVEVQNLDGTNLQLVGHYGSFYEALKACPMGTYQEKQFIVTMNKNYTITPDEGWQQYQEVNIVLRSKDGKQFTLKKEGPFYIFAVFNNGTIRTENIVLDGNSDGPCLQVITGGTVTIGEGTVVQNFADNYDKDQPGITVFDGGVLNIEDGTLIQDNHTLAKDVSGGIIEVRKEGILNIKGGKFKKNTTNSFGGAIIAYGELNITGGEFESNQAQKNGGAIFFSKSATGSFKTVIFKKNQAKKGGAISASGILNLDGTTFKENQAEISGGALYMKKGGTIKNSTFIENISEGGGGALFIDHNFGRNKVTPAPVIRIEGDSTFSENASISFGGGIYVGYNNELIVEGASFIGNEAAYGGGISTAGGMDADKILSKLQVKNVSYQKNEALAGGAIFTAFPTEINGVAFQENVAHVHPQDDQNNPHKTGTGGAIYIMNHLTKIQGSTFIKNEAYGSGGAISFNGVTRDDQGIITGIKPDAEMKISDSTVFKGNHALVGQGGAIYVIPYEYSHTIKDANAYKKLTTDATTLFIGNKTGARLYTPPENYKDFADLLQFDPASDVKHGILEKESLLNNYDVNYKNSYLIIHFDPNGGSGKMENQLVEFDEKREEPLDYKLPKNGFTPPPGKEFQAWEILDKEYKEGSPYSINKDAVEGKGYILVKALWKSKPTTPTTPTNPTTPTGPEIIGGEDRVETGEKVSQRFYTHADNVIVVRKDEFPDALTASVLARALDAPILLTSTDHLDAKTAAEIRRLGATKAYIIGKENAIAESTAQEVKKITGKIERIGGSDRYETSSLIAKKVVATIGNTKKAVIATGQDFADALSISPYAAKMGYPILLVKQNQLPSVIQKTIKDLSISGVYVAGGDKAVSKSLDKVLPKILARFDGENRYDTARIIAETLFAHSKTAFLASGQVFADVLVISPVAAREDGPVLLTRPSILPAETKAAIDKAHYEKIFVVGLEKAINKKVWEVLR